VRGSGSIKRGAAYRRHILTKKSTKVKRQLRRTSAVDNTNTRAIRSMLPYSG
jgi:large subunit ribosomal protein L35